MTVPSLADQAIESLLRNDLLNANGILERNPDLTCQDFYLACASGDSDSVRTLLHGDSACANRLGGPREWVPLLYVCYSRFLGQDVKRSSGMRDIAQLLLDHGADPNAHFKVNDDPNALQTCLYGAAGIANDAPLTQLLLEAGADPNDQAPGLGPESLYHASEFRDIQCLRLILESKPDPAKVSYCLRRKLDFDHPVEGVRLYLEHGADPNNIVPGGHGGTPFHAAIRRFRDVATLEALFEFGADLSITTSTGHTPYALATRIGNAPAADFCLKQGAAPDEASSVDQFIGHCMQGREKEAWQCVTDRATLQSNLTISDHAIVAEAAMNGKVEAVRLLIQAGFRIDVPNDSSAMQALHWAGWHGNDRLTEILLESSPPLEDRNIYGSTPLDAAVYGVKHCPEPQGDYYATIERLLKAGCNANSVSPFPSGNASIDALVRPYRDNG